MAQESPQDFDRQHELAMRRNPTGVVFTLSFKDGKTRFYPGEIIRLELSFSSTLTNAYALDAATYDRSGRLPSEQWRLYPSTNIVDPLADYFSEGTAGGGLRSIPALSNTPEKIVVVLNEWVRLNRPGKYRLYDVSTRLYDERESTAGHEELPVVSTLVEFEILPADKKWAARTLRDAVQALDRTNNHEAVAQAAEVMRFLDTPDAARELPNRLVTIGDNGRFDCHLGLFSSPHRATIVKEMEKRLTAPDFPVTPMFLHDCARLSALSIAAPEIPSGLPEDETQMAQWQAIWQMRHRKEKATRNSLWQELFAALPAKHGPAKNECLVTLIECSESVAPTNPTPLWTQQQEALRKELAAVFAQLPADTQHMLLECRWPLVRTPTLLPVLRHLAKQDGETTYSGKEARVTALKRLAEASPAIAREIILREIRTPHPGLPYAALSALPDATLPELDDHLTGHLEKDDGDMELWAQLVCRYASTSALERVQRVYGDPPRGWACDFQASLLKYFFRVAPDYGVEMVEKALLTTNTGCRNRLLTDVAKPEWASRLEPIAVRQLVAPNPEMAGNAAAMLGQYGSAATRQPLRQRLEQFHEQWKHNADALRYRHGADPTDMAQAHLEISLVEALANASRWVADKALLQQMRPLCLTEQSRSIVDNWLTQWERPFPIRLSHWSDGDEWSVAWFYRTRSPDDLRQKLAQFPLGTSFRIDLSLVSDAETRQKDEAFIHLLREFLQSQGMKLEP